MNDQEPLDTLSPQNAGRRGFGLAITAVVLGLLSFVVGLGFFSSSKTGAPADGNRPAAKNTVEQLAESQETNTDPKPHPKRDPKPRLDDPRQPLGEDITNSIGMKFKRIKAGEFLMPPFQGVVKSGKESLWEKITFREPFYLGVYLVTQHDYETVMEENPSYYKQGGGAALSGRLAAGIDTKRFPVECVNYNDAKEFCAQLSALPAEKAAGRSYRMPSEVEWDYACRAGTNTAYFFGNDVARVDDYAWFIENSGGRPHPVGQKKANGWGLYDMQGNVYELCVDWYLPQFGVVRGGCWENNAKDCPVAYRSHGWVYDRTALVGFRVVCVVGATTR